MKKLSFHQRFRMNSSRTPPGKVTPNNREKIRKEITVTVRDIASETNTFLYLRISNMAKTTMDVARTNFKLYSKKG
jgi:hypothetical protein